MGFEIGWEAGLCFEGWGAISGAVIGSVAGGFIGTIGGALGGQWIGGELFEPHK
ncbi:hypothetical protein [Bacteroides sedimenti]|uniref:Uncharacterized protein n=1 Tax=Bacteroides sedimenti TaxID=2136147 RepID=A0ABM8I800_9BACE